MTGTFSFGNQNPDDCDGWRDKLVGKVVLDDEEVTSLEENEYIRKKDLPQPNRVLAPGAMTTMDFRPERLNVRVDHTMRVTGVNFG